MGSNGGILESYFRAVELRSRLGDLLYRKEQRERERQLFDLQLERHKRENQAQDFTFRRALAEMGAIPGNSEVEDALDEAYDPPRDPRMRVSPPGGGDCYVPTQRERDERNLNLRLREYEGKEEIDRRVAQKNLLPVEIPEKLRPLFGGASTWSVERGKVPDAVKWFRETSKPDVKAMHFPRGVFFYDNEDIADKLEQSGGSLTMELPDLAAPQNEYPAMPGHIERKAENLAWAIVSKSGGFTNGRRESQEFKDSVGAKAQEYINRAAGRGETLSQAEALQKARVYYLAGDGKGSVERYEKLEDSDAYRQGLQRQRDSLYEGYRKGRGLSSSPKPSTSQPRASSSQPTSRKVTMQQVREYAAENGLTEAAAKAPFEAIAKRRGQKIEYMPGAHNSKTR